MRILITGTPGVGKTTVCRILSSLIGVPCITIADLLAGRDFTSWDPEADTYDVLDVEAAREYLASFLAGDHIADTHVLEVLPSRGYLAFVLRKRPDALMRDLLRRGWRMRKVLDNVWAELTDYVYVQAKGLFKALRQIDVTERGPEEVAAVISKCVAGGGCIDEEVDWLEYATRSGLMESLEKYYRQ